MTCSNVRRERLKKIIKISVSYIRFSWNSSVIEIAVKVAGMHVEKLQYVLHVLIDVHSNMPYANFAHGLWPPTAWNFDMIKKCLPG